MLPEERKVARHNIIAFDSLMCVCVSGTLRAMAYGHSPGLPP